MSLLEWLPNFKVLDPRMINFGALLLGSVKYLTSALAVLVAVHIYQSRQRLRTLRLRGPPSPSFLFGVTKKLFPSSDIGVIYHDWERTYGPVYEIPAGLGTTPRRLERSQGHRPHPLQGHHHLSPSLIWRGAVAGPLVSSRVRPAIFPEPSSHLFRFQFGDSHSGRGRGDAQEVS
jgi:hypothetical protein